MFLNIGSDIVIFVNDIVSIVNIEKKGQKSNRQSKNAPAAKTMIITSGGTHYSHISSKTLKRRLAEIICLFNNEGDLK